MKRILFSTGFLLSFSLLLAQVPDNYYAGTENLRGKALKHALYEIIKGQKEYPYSSSNTDVWDILKETDKDTANPDNVILFYTGWSVNAAQEYNNGKGWNREHVWAKSRGDFGTTPGPGTDVNNIRPADVSVNSARNNRSFDTCTVPYLDNGIATGCYTSTDKWAWEPRKEVQGDVARMIFYMATRYEGENGEPNLRVVDYLPSKDDKSPVQGKLSTLLIWNERDTVDSFERHRNDVVYSYQHNRNPYIDHPEFVNRIWGKDSIATGIKQKQIRYIEFYPNPVTNTIHFRNTEGLYKELFSMEGKLIKRTTKSMLNIRDLSPGIYMVVFKNRNSEIVKRMKLEKL